MIISGCYHAMAGEDSESPTDESTRFAYYQHLGQMIRDAKSQSKEADLKELFKSGFTSWSGECYKFTEESQTSTGKLRPSEMTSFELLVRIEKRDDFEVSFGIPPVFPRVEIESEGTFSLRIYGDAIEPGSGLLCENPYLIQKEGRDVLLCQVVKTGLQQFRTATHACYFLQTSAY